MYITSVSNHNSHISQPVQMDLIKKFFPKQKTIQTLKVDTQGFRITINENPPTLICFVNPPEGSEHGQKCIEPKKKNTLCNKKTCCQPNFLHAKFFLSQFYGNSRNLQPKTATGKKIISRLWYIREKFRLQKVGVAAGFSQFKVLL